MKKINLRIAIPLAICLVLLGYGLQQQSRPPTSPEEFLAAFESFILQSRGQCATLTDGQHRRMQKSYRRFIHTYLPPLEEAFTWEQRTRLWALQIESLACMMVSKLPEWADPYLHRTSGAPPSHRPNPFLHPSKKHHHERD